MKRLIRLLTVLLALLLISSVPALAQSGKITGTVVDENDEPLPGVNIVLIEGTEPTTQGAQTNAEGFYTILNIEPGTYSLRASSVGYTSQVKQGVRVNVDLTTEVDFQMQEETVGLDEVIIEATEPVVKRDVSASVANLNAEEIENLPVTDVAEVVGLQAGFEPGLTIRGESGSQVSFRVDGLSMATGRDNTPFTGVSYTAVDEIQVQTGGFNAEYGNVRAGLINVTTKEPPRNRYTVDVITRYTPATQKAFSGTPRDGDAYWIRPYVDDPNVPNDQDPAFIGTDQAWDRFTRRQYPNFEGWNDVASDFSFNTDDDPSNDVSPAELEDAFQHYLRKDFTPDNPDYEIDGTIAGPIPAISEYLGDLRFSASYRQTQDAYIVPQVRETYGDRLFQGKLVSNVAPGAKLEFQGLWSKQKGLNTNEQGYPNMFTGEMPQYPWDNRVGILVDDLDRGGLFATNHWNPMDITRNILGAKFTHTIGSNTFYEVQIQRNFTDYFTRPSDPRSEDVVRRVGPIELTEEPFGFEWRDAFDKLNTGLRTGGHWASSRDSSSVTNWSFSFDVTSQINRFMEVQTGLDYILSNYDTNFGEVDPAHPHHANPKFVWERTPHQGAAYGQTKLEFRGMVANLGLRLDYFNPQGEWYQYDTFSRALSAQVGVDSLDSALSQEPIDRQLALSPRLGVSFPITETSKLYFNYGHFRSMLDPTDLFVIEEINTGAVNRIGNPNHPMPQTVAYELGYEQSLFTQYLVRVSGYYRDLSNQPRTVRYEDIEGNVEYTVSRPWNYVDIRGIEFTVSKNRGDWIRGFLNYTYMARKEGNFGFSNIYENRVEQREYLRGATDHYPTAPIPEPYARFNLEVVTPEDFGPDWGAIRPLSDFRVNFLGEWRKGQSLTWTGQELTGGRSPVRGLQGNVNWTDYYNLDLRFSKNFNTGYGGVQLFVDVTNVLNLRQMNRYAGFEGERDLQYYMESLHLPGDAFDDLDGGAPYDYIPGGDQPGDYREPGTEFVPIEIVNNTGDVQDPMERPLYYEKDDSGGGTYMQYRDGAWTEADGDFVNEVIDNKQYIDMPNESYFTFLNPRNVYFGMRLSF